MGRPNIYTHPYVLDLASHAVDETDNLIDNIVDPNDPGVDPARVLMSEDFE